MGGPKYKKCRVWQVVQEWEAPADLVLTDVASHSVSLPIINDAAADLEAIVDEAAAGSESDGVIPATWAVGRSVGRSVARSLGRSVGRSVPKPLNPKPP